jgi:uncharacterized protein YcbK (DUF882 family)
MRWSALLVLATVVAMSGASTTVAQAGTAKTTASSANKQTGKRTASSTKSSCKGKKCKSVSFRGHSAARSSLRSEPLARPSGEIWLHVDNLGEEVKVNIYREDGSFDDAALAKLDELFRCVRTGAVRAVRAELYEQLSRIYDHFGSKRVHLVSGFRYAERNSSRHFHASAMDVRIPGVSIKQMYKFAESLDGGGMGIGIYPKSGFIHVDFRAPGEPSYRWTDHSPPGSSKKSKKKKPSHRTQPARKPVS